MGIGNPEVIECLEYWLSEARNGEINYVALGTVKFKEQVAYDYAGAKGLENRVQFALKTLDQEMDMICKARAIGPRNMNLDASYVEYHLTGTPICWDFLIWLVDAEMTRRRYGAPPPLRVAFTREDQLDAVSKSFFENVFCPLLPLIGAIEDPDAKGGRHKPVYVPVDICVAARAGEQVPILQASNKGRETMDLWLHGTEPVTITLREAKHWKHRNSNIKAWLKFAGDLQRKGRNVIFIRDTARAAEPLPGFASCPIAAWNVDLRMALYERSYCNFFVSNGPAGLALFGDRPYLYFHQISEEGIIGKGKEADVYGPFRTEWWYASNGVRAGEQWPWALPNQKMIWQKDTYRNISKAWEKFEPQLQAA